MFEPETDVVELQSRLGRVGSIQVYDIWQGRESREKCFEQIATIACLSRGKDHSENPEKLVRGMLNAKPVIHGEPFECVPFSPKPEETIRSASLRHNLDALNWSHEWSVMEANRGRRENPAYAFRLQMPEMIYIHMLRHGGTFGKNVLSRRFVPDEMYPVTFYGDEWARAHDPERILLWEAQRAEYKRRRIRGEPIELARTAFGNDQFIDLWSWGFARDYARGSSFNLQRTSQASRAQEEISVFAAWIAEYLERR